MDQTPFFKDASVNLKNGDTPNILLIMTDQFRWDWMGCAGADFVRTPNIDRIASGGVRFPMATCQGPICVPSRVALASGMHPHRIGVNHNGNQYPMWVPTYYQHLRNFGYRVATVGKNHLRGQGCKWVGDKGDLPVMYQLGFTDPMETDNCFSGRTNQLVGPYSNYLREKGLLDKTLEDIATRAGNPLDPWGLDYILESEHHCDSFIGRHSCRMLEGLPSESPWHLFASFYGPHDPWGAPPDYAEKYRNAPMPKVIPASPQGKPGWYAEQAERFAPAMEQVDEVQRQYAGCIELIDDWIGKILDVVEARGEMDNTIIIFTADHGEMMGDHGLFRKGNFYESSVRIPMIISGPGIKLKGTSNALVDLFDLAPTILDLTGAPVPAGLDAVSLKPLLEGRVDKVKDYQFSEMGPSTPCWHMVFDGRYKFIHNNIDTDELYDIPNDPQEAHNLINEMPELALKLKKLVYNF